MHAGGEVDVQTLDASHKRNEYLKGDNEEGVVAKKKLFRQRGEGCLNMLEVSGTSATELAITLKASPILSKLNPQLLAQGYADAVDRAKLLTQMAGKCGYRKGPVSGSLMRTLGWLDWDMSAERSRVVIHEPDLWSWVLEVAAHTQTSCCGGM